MPKITKEQFDSLYSDNITKKEYDKIIDLIDVRFSEICEKFLIKNKDLYSSPWFDYGNVSYEDRDVTGSFDIDRYKENIDIGGEWVSPPEGYDACFPTRWLWEDDWEKEMKQTINEYKKLMNSKAEKLKQKNEKKEALKSSIKSKLTPEELKLIKFK